MAGHDGNEKKIQVSLSRKLQQKEVENIKNIADRVIQYLGKSGESNFTGMSYKAGDNRSVFYTYPREAIFNKPLSLASEPPPVGTTGPTTAI